MSASTASIFPKRMPISRLPRSDWLGSSTSPPLMTRSNLSFGPMAPRAGAAAVSAITLDEIRKSRRDNLGTAAPPQNETPLWGSERTKFAHFEHPDPNSDHAQDGKGARP